MTDASHEQFEPDDLADPFTDEGSDPFDLADLGARPVPKSPPVRKPVVRGRRHKVNLMAEVDLDERGADVPAEPEPATETAQVAGDGTVTLSADMTPSELRAMLRRLDEVTVVNISQAAWEVLVEKARQRGDLIQLIEDAFVSAFAGRNQLGVMPWMADGILWAPGAREDSSPAKHDCRFVRVTHAGKGYWVWEHPGRVEDTVRRNQQGAKMSQRSITVVVPEQGAAVDVVTATCRSGIHQVKRVDSFVVSGGELERTERRIISEVQDR